MFKPVTQTQKSKPLKSSVFAGLSGQKTNHAILAGGTISDFLFLHNPRLS